MTHQTARARQPRAHSSKYKTQISTTESPTREEACLNEELEAPRIETKNNVFQPAAPSPLSRRAVEYILEI
jgi:hypothetical protein